MIKTLDTRQIWRLLQLGYKGPLKLETMRNYIKLWAQQINMLRTFDGSTTFLVVVASELEEIEAATIYAVDYTNEATAGNPYDQVSVEDPYPIWFEMDKENILQIAKRMYPYALGTSTPYDDDGSFRDFVDLSFVTDSPRETWSHGK